jgi:osmotically-inducible protein OsmY
MKHSPRTISLASSLKLTFGELKMSNQQNYERYQQQGQGMHSDERNRGNWGRRHQGENSSQRGGNIWDEQDERHGSQQTQRTDRYFESSPEIHYSPGSQYSRNRWDSEGDSLENWEDDGGYAPSSRTRQNSRSERRFNQSHENRGPYNADRYSDNDSFSSTRGDNSYQERQGYGSRYGESSYAGQGGRFSGSQGNQRQGSRGHNDRQSQSYRRSQNSGDDLSFDGFGEHRDRQSASFSGQFNGGSPRSLGKHHGKGPKGYNRSDDRIKEEVCDLLMRDSDIDAGDITVEVKQCVVTLSGEVESKQIKRSVEDLCEDILGVQDVENQLKVSRSGSSSSSRSSGQQTSSESKRGKDFNGRASASDKSDSSSSSKGL